MTESTELHSQSPVTLLLTGDVMTGRGVDQILPHPGDPTLHEKYAKSALEYVALAERANGPIPRPVSDAYVWETRWLKSSVAVLIFPSSISRRRLRPAARRFWAITWKKACRNSTCPVQTSTLAIGQHCNRALELRDVAVLTSSITRTACRCGSVGVCGAPVCARRSSTGTRRAQPGAA